MVLMLLIEFVLNLGIPVCAGLNVLSLENGYDFHENTLRFF